MSDLLFGAWPWIVIVSVLALLGAGWWLRIRMRGDGSPPDGPRIVFPEWREDDGARPTLAVGRFPAEKSPGSARSWMPDSPASPDPPREEGFHTAHPAQHGSDRAEAPVPPPDPMERLRLERSQLEHWRQGPLAHRDPDEGYSDQPRHQRSRSDDPGPDAPASYDQPPEGTLQLLPGRLEIISGTGMGEEFRFVRVPNAEPIVTFGRSTGPPHRHVQLHSPTVSRLHARFLFTGARWQLTNLSSTNPTVLNGRRLDGEAEKVTLSDGDRIELGEVVLVFHHREVQNRLPLRSSWYTDRGRRATNQDAVAISTLTDGRELAVVCDGMGSHAAGGVASYMALEGLTDALQGGASIEEAVREANAVVWAEGRRSSSQNGMATTMVVMLRDGDRYRIANVGDSRAYRIDGDGVHHITEDHSFVAEAVRNGEMSREEADRSPWKHAVTRMLGTGEEVRVDVFGPYSASQAHLVILCSDGVHGVLTDQGLKERVLAAQDVEGLAKDIGEEALRCGSKDNVGVAVVAFAGGIAHVEKTGTSGR